MAELVEKLDIPPAKLLSSKSHALPGQLLVTELFFQVPLDYHHPNAPGKGQLTLFARRFEKREVPVFAPDEESPPKPYLVYLEGGPGFGNRSPQDHPLTGFAVKRGYQVLYLDHRGTGLSSPVAADSPDEAASLDEKVEYFAQLRQDNTVRDCEAVRKCLTDGWPPHKAPWSIFGQSYGGFISLSYLSMHPEGLRESFLTGGLAPVGKPVDQVYEATYRKVIERNEAYYAKYPEDVDNVRQLADYINSRGGIPLPAGGELTVQRLLSIGISCGGHGGFESVHAGILQLKTSLDRRGSFDRASLTMIENWWSLDSDVIYAVLHEPIYCDGGTQSSRWAAERVGKGLAPFHWLSAPSEATTKPGPLYFTGEMIFPFCFDVYPGLQGLKDVANRLAERKWPKLYDEKQLRENRVPVYAASYIDDMYVDYEFAKETASLVKGTKVFVTNVMYHTALRTKAEEVLQQLFALRDDVLD